MDSEAVKASRRILRRIQDHLYHAHINLGGLQERVNLVDVLHHPTSSLTSLNYVTPRRNTAWVAAEEVEKGLQYIRGLHRTPRVQYIEGLFPPLFSKNMIDLGLQAEWELPLMVYTVSGFNGMTLPPLQTDVLPQAVTIEAINNQRSPEVWQYVTDNAFYDVLTLGVEPLFMGQDAATLTKGYQVDIAAYQGGSPVGISRLSIHDQTAHILALALMKESHTPEMVRALQSATIKAALDRQCDLIYAPGESEDDRRLCREIGFLDFGSILSYSAKPNEDSKESEGNEHILGQPVLALR